MEIIGTFLELQHCGRSIRNFHDSLIGILIINLIEALHKTFMHINSSLSFNSKFNKIISPSSASLMVTLKKCTCSMNSRTQISKIVPEDNY